MPDPSSSDLFLIECSEFPPSARVAGFTGTEGLSQLYHLRIGVLTSGGEEIDLAKVRGFKVSLSITGGAKPMVLHGMIARIALKHAWLGYALYQLELVPMVWATTLSHHSRVFVDMTVPEIVEQLLKDSGIGSDYYDFQLLNDYPKRFHIGQYKESRWNCISRLLEREGMYYFFDHSG
ncbi:MAG: contractile injection system protein, VgrG/Pvc8 family, partial [Polyangiaceae bacterium]